MEKSTKKEAKKALVMIITAIGLSMLIYNILTPLLSDDFAYAGSKNLVDVFVNEYHHYFTTNGRSVAHVMARIMLMLPGILFDVLNTAVYLLLLYLIFRHAANDLRLSLKVSAGMILLIHILLFNYVSNWGSVILWTDGSCNYLWTMVIMLSYLLMYRIYADDQNAFTTHPARWGIGAALLGGLAGWCNENASGGVIMLSLLYMVWYIRRRYRIRLWMLTGFITSVLTFAVMITAPGNQVRSQAAVFTDHRVWYVRICDHLRDIMNQVYAGYKYLLIAIIVFAVLVVYYGLAKEAMLRIGMYALTAVAVFAALCLSPVTKGRPYFCGAVFLVVVCISLAAQLWKNCVSVRTVVLAYAGIMALLFSVNSVNAAMDIAYYKLRDMKRMSIINAYKQDGYTNVVVFKPEVMTRYNPANGLEAIGADTDGVLNTILSQYMELDSVTAVTGKEYDKIFAKGTKSLINIRDINTYLETIRNDRYAVVIVSKGDLTGCISDDVAARLAQLGLQTDLMDGIGYAAVVQNGAVLYEAGEDDVVSVITELDSKELVLNSSKDKIGVKLDGYNYARDREGLGFVVYDLKKNRVVDRVTFEITEEGKAWR